MSDYILEEELQNNLYEANVDAFINMLSDKYKQYPICLYIHPDASQRDIIEYIKSHWKIIEFLKEKHQNPDQPFKIKHSKTSRKEHIKKRNDFIYDNRDLKTKKIRKMLAKQNIFLDDGSIRKIIYNVKQDRGKKCSTD